MYVFIYIYKYIKKDKYVQVEWVFFIHLVVMLMFVRNAEYEVNHQDR